MMSLSKSVQRFCIFRYHSGVAGASRDALDDCVLKESYKLRLSLIEASSVSECSELSLSPREEVIAELSKSQAVIISCGNVSNVTVLKCLDQTRKSTRQWAPGICLVSLIKWLARSKLTVLIRTH